MNKQDYDYELSFVSENEWGQKIIVDAGFELIKDDNKPYYHIIKLKAKTYAFNLPYTLSGSEDEALCEEAYKELEKELAA